MPNDTSYASHTQHALMAPVVAHGALPHSGPKAEALNEFTRQLWMILQSKKEGYRQLHVQCDGARGSGTGMAAEVDEIIASALRMPKTRMPETGPISIRYQLQLSGPEAASPEQRAKMGGDEGGEL